MVKAPAHSPSTGGALPRPRHATTGLLTPAAENSCSYLAGTSMQSVPAFASYPASIAASMPGPLSCPCSCTPAPLPLHPCPCLQILRTLLTCVPAPAALQSCSLCPCPWPCIPAPAPACPGSAPSSPASPPLQPCYPAPCTSAPAPLPLPALLCALLTCVARKSCCRLDR